MPELFTTQADRRHFLKVSGLAGASLLLLGRSTLRGQPATGELHLALLSDTHIPADPTEAYRGFQPWKNLETIVPQVVQRRPAGVILNGDAARLAGLPDDYVQLKQLLAPLAEIAPVCIGMGNHDDRGNFLKAFTTRPYQPAGVTGKHVTVIDHPTVRILQLDSLLYVDKVAGLLGKAQRQWLGNYLADADPRPVVLFIHHTLKDGDGDLLDVDRLFGILRPNPKVKAIFYGHSHVWEIGERDGIQLINLPAVGYNFRDEDPVGWVAARFHGAGVELQLHTVGGNQADQGKITSLKWLR